MSSALTAPTGKVKLTVRIGGKRIDYCKVLEEKQAQLQSQIRQLEDTNSALRAKEAMQFDMLRGYEDSMQKMTLLLCDMAGREGADAAESVAALSAIMVALRSDAQELVQQLRGHAASSPTVHSTLSAPDVNSNSPEQLESSPPNSAGLLEALFPMGSFTGRNTRLMWATVTPETVLELRGITGRQLAERFKHVIARLALVCQVQGKSMHSMAGSVANAVIEYGGLCLLSMCAADRAFLESNTYNMETMEPEAQGEELCRHILSKVTLTLQQRQQLALAYERYAEKRAAFLQQQQSVMQELHSLLAAGAPINQEPSGATTKPSDAYVAAPAAAPGTPVADRSGNAATAAAGASVQQVYIKQEQTDGEDRVMLSRGGSDVSSNSGSGSGLVDMSASRLDMGLLDLEVAERADDLLQRLQRVVRLSREVARNLIYGEQHQNLDMSASRLDMGLLDLEVAERADDLLQRLQRVVRLSREVARNLVYVYIDVLDLEQHADVILAAYPYVFYIAGMCQQIAADVRSDAEAAAAKPGRFRRSGMRNSTHTDS